MSVQETIFLCLAELWFRKRQSGALYLGTNISNQQVRLLIIKKIIRDNDNTKQC